MDKYYEILEEEGDWYPEDEGMLEIPAEKLSHVKSASTREDSEKETVEEILGEYTKLEALIRKSKFRRPPYWNDDWMDGNLYKYPKSRLKKILNNLLLRLFQVLWHMGFRPSPVPYEKVPFLKYYRDNVLPQELIAPLLPPFQAEKALSEEEVETLSLLIHNMPIYAELIAASLYQQHGEKIQELLYSLVRQDIERNPRVTPADKEFYEKELIRYELGKKPASQRKQLEKIYQAFFQLKAQREMDLKQHQRQLFSEGLKRRRLVEKLQKGKVTPAAAFKQTKRFSQTGRWLLQRWKQKQKEKH
jgi:hypothetical protein